MNNIDKFSELRETAVQNGFPKELNRQFFIPVRYRTDGRAYIPNNAENTLLFDPEWLRSLVGGDYESSITEEEGGKGGEVAIPKFEEIMIDLARIRCQRGDTIGFLYEEVKQTLRATG